MEETHHKHTNLAGDPTHHVPNDKVDNTQNPIHQASYTPEVKEHKSSSNPILAILLGLIILLLLGIGGFALGSKYLNGWNPMDMAINPNPSNQNSAPINDQPEVKLPAAKESDLGPAYKQVAKVDPVTTYDYNYYIGDSLILTKAIYSSDSYAAESTENDIVAYTSYTNKYIFYIDTENTQITYYDKATKAKRGLPLPEGFSSSNVEFYDSYIQVLNDKWIVVNLSRKDQYGQSYTFLLNTENFNYTEAKEFANCDVVYCGGPSLVTALSNDEFILEQGGGDSCGGGGVVSKYNALTKTYTKLLDYESGCADEEDDYVGYYKNQLIHTKHFWDEGDGNYEDPNYTGPEVLYLAITSTDISNGQKKTIISEAKMPKNIKSVVLNEESGLIGLYEDYAADKISPSYVFDLNKNDFTNDNFDYADAMGDKYDNKDKLNKLLEANKPFIRIEKANTKYAEIVSANNEYGEYSLRGGDAKGNKFYLLQELDKLLGNDDQATNKYYVFSQWGKPWVRSNYEIEFYVNMRDRNSTKNEYLFAADKVMIMNTQTGVIYEKE